MPAKLATLGLLKIRLFWNEIYEVIKYAHDLTNKILSRNSNHIVNMVMWQNVGNSSISLREVIIISSLWGFDHKSRLFVGWYWFYFNNLGVALGMELKFSSLLQKG